MATFTSVTVGLAVTDLERAVEWYRRLLGGLEEMEPAPGIREFRLTPSTWLQLFEGEVTPDSPTVVRLESGDAGASHAIVARLGEEVGEIETVPGAVRYFEFRDPFGNLLSFYEVLE